MAGGPENSSPTEPSSSRKRPVSSTPSHNTRSKRARTRGALETMVSTSVLRPKSKRKRSIKGKERAASSEEEEDEAEPAELNDVKQVAEYHQNSASQSSSGASSPSDAKLSSTTSLELVESSLARAQKELASKNEVRRPPRVLAMNVERPLKFVVIEETNSHSISTAGCSPVPNMFGNAMAALFVRCREVSPVRPTANGSYVPLVLLLAAMSPARHVLSLGSLNLASLNNNWKCLYLLQL